MRDQIQSDDPLDIELYTTSQTQLFQFKSRLPTDTVENLAREVLLRLREQDAEPSIDRPSGQQIDQLCLALLADDPLEGAAFIRDVRSAGASIEAVYLKYLAAAARKFGDWWDDDIIPFSKVTLGTSRMYAIMRALRRQVPPKLGPGAKSAIFASVPGETHTLGVRMATDLFRKEGWDIDLVIGEDHDHLVAELVRAKAPLIGISAGGHHSMQALWRLVVALRIKAPTKAVFVSGQIAEEALEAIDLIGVDGVAEDITSARALMTELMGGLKAT